MAAAKKKKQKKPGEVAIFNKKARHDYEINDSFEVGIVLSGGEVKSIRAGEAQLKESYVRVRASECYLIGCHISPYRFTNDPSYNPTAERKLLLHKREILKLNRQIMQKGLTVVPLKMYFNDRGKCKLEIGIGRGKKIHDKRQSIKEKDIKRTIERYKD
ncbi:UNVERIFIED_CONTAM: hypothetical protein GTU68_009986 [Idotea baltica]|nr:hypothetical protein [Idotea baltica]